jgi:hypothetical protein
MPASPPLTQSGNNIGGTVTASGNDISVTDSNGLTVGNVTAATVGSDAGDLSLTATSGNITQTSGTSITTTGDASLTATAGDITLTNTDNNIGGSLSASAKGIPSIKNNGSMVSGSGSTSPGGQDKPPATAYRDDQLTIISSAVQSRVNTPFTDMSSTRQVSPISQSAGGFAGRSSTTSIRLDSIQSGSDNTKAPTTPLSGSVGNSVNAANPANAIAETAASTQGANPTAPAQRQGASSAESSSTNGTPASTTTAAGAGSNFIVVEPTNTLRTTGEGSPPNQLPSRLTPLNVPEQMQVSPQRPDKNSMPSFLSNVRQALTQISSALLSLTSQSKS